MYFYIFSRATLNETFTAKYDDVLPYHWYLLDHRTGDKFQT